jgi:hypothetical protein
MPSITSWTRLEPRTRNPQDLSLGLQARVHDPLWMLTRQWQLGEFQAQDAASPVVANLTAAAFPLTRYAPAAGPPQNYDGTPLEAFVEREPVPLGAGAAPRLAAEAGLHFFRLLDAGGVGGYRAAYLAAYALAPGDTSALDPDSQAYLALMAGRVPDGAHLHDDLSAALRAPGRGTLPSSPPVAAADLPAVTAAATAWLSWCDGLYGQPAGPSAWTDDRMEYQFAVSAALGGGTELTLAASAYAQGSLDWYSFDGTTAQPLGAQAGGALPLSETAVPAPVAFRGMPAPRWWEMEDASANLGAIQAGLEDLAKMVFAEFAAGYGNDWKTLAVDAPAGSICQITSLVITDTFGLTTTIPAYQVVDGAGGRVLPWQMFSTSPVAGTAPPPPALLIPPTVLAGLAADPVEQVLLLRDDAAAMAWAVEDCVESPLSRKLDRHEQQYRQAAPTAPPASTAALAYRPAILPPPYWIPLVPTQVPVSPGQTSLRLVRGALLDVAGTRQLIPPQGQLLAADQSLALYDHEVPREGAQVTRAYRYARAADGTPLLWIGRRKTIGRGQGWSGLRFDALTRSPS